MSRPLVLEDFDRQAAPRHSGPAPGASSVELEEERLKAFEKGYGAGWEDAARAHEEEQERISAELGRSLQEMSFTFHEAQAALVRDVETVLAGVVEAVLPEALLPAMAAMIRERALAAAEAATAGTVLEVMVAPRNVARVEGLVDGRPAPPLRVVGEPSLGAGQAFLRFGASEEKIDLDAALSELRDAVARFAAGAPEEPPGETGVPPAGEGDPDAKEMRYA